MVYEAPDFIGFNVANRQAFDLLVHDPLCFLSRQHQQVKDCLLMQSGKFVELSESTYPQA